MSPCDASKAVVRAYFERAMAGEPTLTELFADDATQRVREVVFGCSE